MDERTVVFLFGYGGAALGLLGAALGSYFEFRHAKAQGPRRLLVTALWIALCCLAALAFVLAPRPYRPLAWLAFPLLWLVLVARNRRRQLQSGMSHDA